jgi:hypothetical protein
MRETTVAGVDGAYGLSGRVGILPAGEGILPEQTVASRHETATKDASLGGQDAHPTRDTLDRHDKLFCLFKISEQAIDHAVNVFPINARLPFSRD